MSKQPILPVTSDVAASAPPGRATVVATLRAHEAEIRAFGIASLSLFGSVARNEARAGSDIDLFCDVASPRFGLIALGTAQDALSALLGAKVDLATRESLRPEFRPKIEATAVRVF